MQVQAAWAQKVSDFLVITGVEREEAMARPVETARAWHAKLAEDFAARATEYTGAACTTVCTQTAIAG